MKEILKKLKFHWKLGIAINIPIIILFIIAPLISGYIFEKGIIKEAIEVRLRKNYEFAYTALIKGHENMPSHIYNIYKQEFLNKFPGIRIYPKEEVTTYFNLAHPENTDNYIETVLKTGEIKTLYNKDKKILHGYFPIKTEPSCLVCHPNVTSDSILGAIAITIPLKASLDSILFTKILLLGLGVLGIILTSVILYFVYMKFGHEPINKITKYLNLLAEGDLTFTIDRNLLDQPDIIGDLARNLEKLKNYLNNFNSRVLDFSLKLTNQVDRVFKTVDTINKDIKASNLSINEIEMFVEDLYLTINEISRKLIQINTLLRVLMNLSSKDKEKEKLDWEKINETINNLNDAIIELIEKIETVLIEDDKISNTFSEIDNLFNKINKTLEQINSYVYENLIISTYMKNLAASVKLEHMEKIIFDIFETDIDRYLLRIESHIKGIESLDPIRWGDPKALTIGKWIESDEYKNLKNKVSDFDFNKFESLYNNMFELAKEIITAYNREDYLTVDNKLEQFKKTYFDLKAYLQELKAIYLNIMESGKQ